MSSQATKLRRFLATLENRDDASARLTRQIVANLPEPGSPWPQNPPPEFPMPWASHWGEDIYGLWCAFTVENVVQKMRWIPPGDFWMGSPENEAERFDEREQEHRHRVRLTTGFWLAETACTQALWQAVTGEKPSLYTGENNPVERVSWHHVGKFCERLNGIMPVLQVRRPSEAEWEYACRAGTESAFWWGEALTVELANYDGDVPYDEGPQGEKRGKTVDVKAFLANPWGLYQVHGNVWEWCEDVFNDAYPDRVLRVDPLVGGRRHKRVIRGGSWINFGSSLRAARRGVYGLGLDHIFLGFRLAAGPRPGGAKEPEKDAGAS